MSDEPIDPAALIRDLRKAADQAGMILTDPPQPTPMRALLHKAADAIDRLAGRQDAAPKKRPMSRDCYWLFIEGVEACCANKPKAANPYDPDEDGDAFTAWNAGWMSIDEDDL